MKKISLLLITALSCSAFAGGEGSGADDGGQGVVCAVFTNRQPDHFTVETLDLYEARSLYGPFWAFPKPQWDYDIAPGKRKLAYRLLDRKIEFVSSLLKQSHTFVRMAENASNLRPVEIEFPGELLPTQDSGRLNTKLRSGCEIVQLAVRSRTSNIIRLDMDYARVLLPIDLAAIFLHEALHEYFDEKKSNLVVRQAVMYVLASREFQMRNRDVFVELVETKRAVDPRRFR